MFTCSECRITYKQDYYKPEDLDYQHMCYECYLYEVRGKKHEREFREEYPSQTMFEAYRSILELHKYGIPTDEIAEVLGYSAVQVRKIIRDFSENHNRKVA